MHSWTEAWLWLWLPDIGNFNAPSNINPANTNPSVTNSAKFTKSVVAGRQLFKITLKLTDFTGKSKSEIKKIGMLIKGNNWSDGQSADHIVTLSQGYTLLLESPTQNYGFYNTPQAVNVKAKTSENSTITIRIDGAIVLASPPTKEVDYTHQAIVDGQVHTIHIQATNGSSTKSKKYTYTSTPTPSSASLPVGMKEGINYHTGDPTKVTLVLKAPQKNFVFAMGDFNDWQLNNNHLMKKSGDYFWVTIDNLIAQKEYIFQYLVDGSLLIADPYTDKVSDPWDDKHIPSSTYAGLIAYPTDQTKHRASVLQTGQSAYSWQVSNFQPPNKEDLVIYELLVRDFSDQRTYSAVVDKLDYLKNLGINALELMPINEFEGNLSWGYNPNFYFAPDKFYGTKNSLKKLVDECHKRGIAVLMDLVLNHSFNSSPQARMYWNDGVGRPASNNPWYNTNHNFQNTAAHWGSDFNHESSHTQTLIDSVNHYWISEYKIDGFRFDFTKGFGNNFKNSSDSWGSKYDADRIRLLKRMADKIWSYAPNSYVIFEHLAENSEERELANHGIMLWGNMNHTYRELAKGGTNGLSGMYYKLRSWNQPNLVGYMESHDEERVAWDALNTNPLAEVMNRLKLNAAFFFTIPGPKMLWQFQEMGYDEQLNNDRLAIKPTHWEYLDIPERQALHQVYQSLIKLKTKNTYFHSQYFQWSSSGTVKWITSTHPDVQIAIVGNFGSSWTTTKGHFTKNGTWHDYFSKATVEVNDFENQKIELSSGEFKIYTSKPIDNYLTNNPTSFVTATEEWTAKEPQITIYPNPVTDRVTYKSAFLLGNIQVRDIQGRVHFTESIDERTIDTQRLTAGMYILTGQNYQGKTYSLIFIKE